MSPGSQKILLSKICSVSIAKFEASRQFTPVRMLSQKQKPRRRRAERPKSVALTRKGQRAQSRVANYISEVNERVAHKKRMSEMPEDWVDPDTLESFRAFSPGVRPVVTEESQCEEEE